MSFLPDENGPRPCQVCNKIITGMLYISTIDRRLEGLLYLCMLYELLEVENFCLCANCFDAISKCAKAILNMRRKTVLFPHQNLTTCLICCNSNNLKVCKISENNTLQYAIRRFKGNIVVQKIDICLFCDEILNNLNEIYNSFLNTQTIIAGQYDDDEDIMVNKQKYYDPNLVVFVPDLEAAIAEAMADNDDLPCDFLPKSDLRDIAGVVSQGIEVQSSVEVPTEIKPNKAVKSMEEYLAEEINDDDDSSSTTSSCTEDEVETDQSEESKKKISVETKASCSRVVEKENNVKSPLKVIRTSASLAPAKVLSDINSDEPL